MKKTLRYLALLLAILCVIMGTVAVAAATADDLGEATPDSPDIPDNGDYGDSGDYGDNGDYGDHGNYGDYGNYGDNGSSSGDAGSVADANALVDTSLIHDVDTTPSKWSDISIDPDSVKGGDSNLSFASIKTDDRLDPNDNGQWILWLGYALITLSVLGVLYFIVSTLNARKIAERERRHNGTNRTEATPAASASSASRTADEQPVSRSAPSRAGGHHADGRKSSRRASKEDTAEVYIPRRVSK